MPPGRSYTRPPPLLLLGTSWFLAQTRIYVFGLESSSLFSRLEIYIFRWKKKLNIPDGYTQLNLWHTHTHIHVAPSRNCYSIYYTRTQQAAAAAAAALARATSNERVFWMRVYGFSFLFCFRFFFQTVFLRDLDERTKKVPGKNTRVHLKTHMYTERHSENIIYKQCRLGGPWRNITRLCRIEYEIQYTYYYLFIVLCPYVSI